MTSILAGFDNNISLLELGKRFSQPGIGLSQSARASTNQFLSQSQNGLNVLLSAGVETSIEGAQTQILAIQSRLPASSIGSFAARFDAGGDDSDSVPASTTRGTNIDTDS